MENFRILGEEQNLIKGEKFEDFVVDIANFEIKKQAIVEAKARCNQIIDEQNIELEKLAQAELELEFEAKVIEQYNLIKTNGIVENVDNETNEKEQEIA